MVATLTIVFLSDWGYVYVNILILCPDEPILTFDIDIISSLLMGGAKLETPTLSL